ncbi:MAG: hypothetical protein OXI96_08010 [Acidimicrobiaceae bacterium]|nr:hypothetical protein [Acidimicrobiaceae bacterium]
MSSTLVFQPDDDLIFLAQDVLSNAGYQVKKIPQNGITVLLAENKYSILGLTATATIRDIETAESALAGIMQDAIRDSRVELGPKSWEMYLVLLTREKLGEQDAITRTITRTIFEIRYDMRQFRRIVRVGVSATERAVRRALVSFLDFPELGDRTFAMDPLELLSSALAEHGITKEKADRAVGIYRTRERT